ncbi:MAG: glycoside hydrolase family 2 TIM barrel-domain containing protein [Candidatus Omnitrophota bacterium]|nr:glycoside hydrolase family 2 TIM barrel-domain containing protein [Candidatus Omnitrophota bacterium]
MKPIGKVLYLLAFFAFFIAVDAESAKVTWDEKNIYVDGKLFYVKGICYSLNRGPEQAFLSIPFEVWEKDFKMIAGAGINTIRTYAPLPPPILDLAHEYGLKVIENICYPTEKTDYTSKADLEMLKRTALAYVKRDKNHPAILMWSIWNDMPFKWSEGGSILNKYSKKTVNSFLKELYLAIKEQDMNHPVTGSNTLPKSGEEIGFDFLDVIGFNAFLGISDWFKGKFRLHLAKKQVRKIKRIASLKYKKPALILETGYSTYCRAHDQGKILNTQIKLAGSDVAGVVVFQWADGWEKAGNHLILDDHIEEHWGIVDGYRNKKSGYNAVSRIFGAIPTCSKGYGGIGRF